MNTAVKNIIEYVPPLALDCIVDKSALAFGLRRLTKKYAGSPIRVRRGSDSSELDIPFCGNELCSGTLLNFVGTENLMTYSEAISNWTPNNMSATDNFAVAPSGEQTATKLQITTAVAAYAIRSATITAGTTYTASAYVKGVDISWCYFQLTNAAQTEGGRVWFDFTNGVIGTATAIGAATLSAQRLVSVGNGWYRMEIVVSLPGTTTRYLGFIPVTANGTNTTPSVGTSAYFWGAQLNSGSTANTYTKTTTGLGGRGFVTTWYDQSGNGKNLTQTVANNQPIVANAGAVNTLSGKASIRFGLTSSTTSLALTGLSLSNLTTYNVVCNNTDSTFSGNLGVLAFGDATYNTNRQHLIVNPSVGIWSVGQRYPENSSAVWVNSTAIPFLVSYSRYSTTSQKAWVSGVAQAEKTDITTTWNATDLTVGSIGAGQNLIGNVSEVIIYPTLLDFARQKIERNQGKYYNIGVI